MIFEKSTFIFHLQFFHTFILLAPFTFQILLNSWKGFRGTTWLPWRWSKINCVGMEERLVSKDEKVPEEPTNLPMNSKFPFSGNNVTNQREIKCNKNGLNL